MCNCNRYNDNQGRFDSRNDNRFEDNFNNIYFGGYWDENVDYNDNKYNDCNRHEHDNETDRCRCFNLCVVKCCVSCKEPREKKCCCERKEEKRPRCLTFSRRFCC